MKIRLRDSSRAQAHYVAGRNDWSGFCEQVEASEAAEESDGE